MQDSVGLYTVKATSIALRKTCKARRLHSFDLNIMSYWVATPQCWGLGDWTMSAYTPHAYSIPLPFFHYQLLVFPRAKRIIQDTRTPSGSCFFILSSLLLITPQSPVLCHSPSSVLRACDHARCPFCFPEKCFVWKARVQSQSRARLHVHSPSSNRAVKGATYQLKIQLVFP